MFDYVTSFFSQAFTSPSVQSGSTVTVTALIIPANGTPPRLTRLPTINVSSDGNVDRFLHHVPDMRAHWGSGSGWRCRDMARVDIKNNDIPTLNGCYFGFKSFAVDDLPMSQYGRGIYGDACIVKMAPEKYCSRGFRIVKIGEKEYPDLRNELARYAVYDNIPEDILETGLWKEIVARLSEV